MKRVILYLFACQFVWLAACTFTPQHQTFGYLREDDPVYASIEADRATVGWPGMSLALQVTRVNGELVSTQGGLGRLSLRVKPGKVALQTKIVKPDGNNWSGQGTVEFIARAGETYHLEGVMNETTCQIHVADSRGKRVSNIAYPQVLRMGNPVPVIYSLPPPR